VATYSKEKSDLNAKLSKAERTEAVTADQRQRRQDAAAATRKREQAQAESRLRARLHAAERELASQRARSDAAEEELARRGTGYPADMTAPHNAWLRVPNGQAKLHGQLDTGKLRCVPIESRSGFWRLCLINRGLPYWHLG
jgi:hypothetical protein